MSSKIFCDLCDAEITGESTATSGMPLRKLIKMNRMEVVVEITAHSNNQEHLGRRHFCGDCVLDMIQNLPR